MIIEVRRAGGILNDEAKGKPKAPPPRLAKALPHLPPFPRHPPIRIPPKGGPPDWSKFNPPGGRARVTPGKCPEGLRPKKVSNHPPPRKKGPRENLSASTRAPGNPKKFKQRGSKDPKGPHRRNPGPPGENSPEQNPKKNAKMTGGNPRFKGVYPPSGPNGREDAIPPNYAGGPQINQLIFWGVQEGKKGFKKFAP